MENKDSFYPIAYTTHIPNSNSSYCNPFGPKNQLPFLKALKSENKKENLNLLKLKSPTSSNQKFMQRFASTAIDSKDSSH